MIERLGGQIGFESENGVGTVFFIEFPVRQQTDRDRETIPKSERSTECTLIERLQRLQKRALQNKKLKNRGFKSAATESSFYQISSSKHLPRVNTRDTGLTNQGYKGIRTKDSNIMLIQPVQGQAVKDPSIPTQRISQSMILDEF